jgi:quinoprotein glucose dehydrogenase
MPLLPPPFARQRMDETDLFGTTPEMLAAVRERFRGLRFGPAWNPPSLEGTVCVPGFHGGATWSGASFDPVRGWLFVNSNNVPNVMKMEPDANGPLPFKFAGYTQLLAPDGYPAIQPPWGALSAIDLNAGRIAWQVPLGEFPELTARGMAPTGTENFGGTICTAGGLVFIGGSMDEKFRAFDAETGTVLWEATLPAGGYATPCTYAVNGRQFVCIAAGGAGKLRTRAGDAFVAFALPSLPVGSDSPR